jgi:type I site-specific restriction endonuclease
MASMEITDLSERDICTKHVAPALAAAGWTQQQFPEEVSLTAGRVLVRGNLAYRLKEPGAHNREQTTVSFETCSGVKTVVCP